MRLDKLLANLGFGSRSDVKEMVKKGRVRIGGELAKRPETDIAEDAEVTCDGIPVSCREKRYFVLNKPAGFISATYDGRTKTVMDIVRGRGIPLDMAPVGRLDKDTVGLLLITNDGALAHSLLSPKKHVDKEYYAKVDGILDNTAVEKFRGGIEFSDFTSLPADLKILCTDKTNGTSEALVTIHEGKFHEVKRLFAAVGCEVTYLKRTAFGPLSLTDDLPEGEFREIDIKEVMF